MDARKLSARHLIALAMMLIVAVSFAMPEVSSASVLKPAKVTGPKVVKTTYNTVTIKWKAAKRAKTYEVWRATGKSGKYKKIKTVKGTRFTDKNRQTGQTVWYKVRGVNGKKKGKFSVRFRAVPRLAKPTLLTSSSALGPKVTAGKVTGAHGYMFYRDGALVSKQKTRVFQDKKVAPGTSHTYKAVAYRNVGKKVVRSPFSRALSASRLSVNVSLDGATKVPTLTSGSSFTLKGKITASIDIKRLEIGVVDASTQKWMVGAKYDNAKVNSKTFDIARADNYVKFGILGPGTYRYRIYVHLEDGSVVTLLNQTFTVKGQKGINGAVAWAIRIANDDSFSYGKGKAAHKRGCYFCGTNKKYKPKGYEKTYCCNPFIFAAYAHGANNQAILKSCQKGGCGGMSPSDWTKYGCFRYVGTCKKVPFDQLRKGDVILSDSSKGGKWHHVWMYCGGGRYVEAGGNGWGPSTIEVSSGAEKYYNKYYRKYSGTTVVRYTGK